MSKCLITIAESNSFVHRAGDLLSKEFEATHHKIETPETQLQQVVEQIHPNKNQSITTFETLLNRAGFDSSLILEHQSCVVLSSNVVPIDLISVNGNDIGRQIPISHIVSDNFLKLISQGSRGMVEKEISLKRIVFLPITKLPPGFSRIEQDLIKSALGFASRPK